MMNEKYLGDAVYAQVEETSGMLCLTTGDLFGNPEHDQTIWINMTVLSELLNYIKDNFEVANHDASVVCPPCIQEYHVQQVFYGGDASDDGEVCDVIFFRGQLMNAERLPKEVVKHLIESGTVERIAHDWNEALKSTVGKG